ncbi:hypothetical protein IWW36_003094 [Coemansia brasiliensis]|uniref:Nudix hydrolase domain-containing protein n=1 Tax=Coemansia brasiliensis TaxID=2650707 RepID=A0A9W8LZA9_9FUNG|nr:hypothetical protein IWW36_003094 [Coemansia brasiliensis]
MSEQLTLLQIAKHCNCVGNINALLESNEYYKFIVNEQLVGLISAKDIPALKLALNRHPVLVIDDTSQQVQFHDSYNNSCSSRTAGLKDLLAFMREQKSWPSLAKWRDELYPVYGDAKEPNGISLYMERAASYNFGIRTFGVHINGIVKNDEGIRMWVAKRSINKQTYPGMLDQIAAGGIGNGIGVRASMLKECDEEAGIPLEIAQQAKCAGTIQYFMQSELGLQPETQYIYDLELPSDFVPFPKDGEVDSFSLWTIDKVVEHMKNNKFKPNCALFIIDFLIRHDFINPENEPDFLRIMDNIHRPLPFPGA